MDHLRSSWEASPLECLLMSCWTSQALVGLPLPKVHRLSPVCARVAVIMIACTFTLLSAVLNAYLAVCHVQQAPEA